MLTTRELISMLYGALDNKLKKHRGNWEQNDPTAKDYIKNRPFYTDESKRVDIVKETTFSGSSQYKTDDAPSIYQAQIPIVPGSQLINNTTYTVVFDGVTYNCTSYLFDGIMVIGDEGMVYSNPSGTEPFLFAIMDKVTGLIIYTGDGTHTVSIYSEKIKKIDKKYLPDDIISDLADVAYSGNYYDLENAPNDVIRYNTAQNLTSTQKQRVRNNIGAADVSSTYDTLKYTAQALSDAQKEQARNNIGANITFDTTPITGSTNPVTSDGIKSYVDGIKNYVDETNVQSDWNIKDENDLAFIKSKPFYHNIEYTPISSLTMSNVATATSFNETARLFYGTKNKTAPSGISDGQQYKIILDNGLNFIVTARKYKLKGSYTYVTVLGNAQLGVDYGLIDDSFASLPVLDTEEPFCHIIYYNTSRNDIIARESNTRMSSIDKITEELVQLDDKFIPSTVPVIKNANVGHFISVSSVDENGQPTAWTAENPYTYSQTDLEAGVSELETGKLYFVYE